MPEEPLGARPSQYAQGNTAPFIQIAGPNSGHINLNQRPKLPFHPVPPKDLTAATDPLWARTSTPQHVRKALSLDGLAVITGEHGTGRRTSALRALRDYLTPLESANPHAVQIYDLSPDWDEDEVPSSEILPDPLPGQGYVLDAAQRTVTAATAQALTSWAAALHQVRSGLVVIGGPTDWPDGRLPEPAVPPDAAQVAHKHLLHRLERPFQAHWLQADPNRAANRGLLRQTPAPDQTGGIFADLIPRNVSPANAVRIAERLAQIDPEHVGAAVQAQHNSDPAAAERAHEYLQSVREQVLEWTHYLEKLLAEGGTRGQDRVMLLAAAYLEDAPLELCITAATEFDPHGDQTRQRFREGRSPRRRLRDVGVDVTETDTATFATRPGLAMAAIRTDWHHWANERTQTRQWLQRITAPGAVAQEWSKQVGRRLLGLSRTAVAPPFFPVLESWASAGINDDRITLIAELLTEAALTEELARPAHGKLLDWAGSGNPARRQVVAQVCAGRYGQRWPSHALVRLRHVLAYDDKAAQIAAAALVEHASQGGLKRIIGTIETWLERFPSHAAGPRAFLALTDPSPHGAAAGTVPTGGVASALITHAQSAPQIRDFLITGWAATLQQPDVRDSAYRVLLAWAEAVHRGSLDRDVTFGILTEVRNLHTPVDAMSRFLYGSPEHDAPAVVDARYALANLNACTHAPCPRTDCPLLHTGSTAPPETEHQGALEKSSNGLDASSTDPDAEGNTPPR
ncbi:hypothetical protein [Actinomadura mexicana]|uniref:Uncharacterized protein n=1 Tax=Actinomadura mexicana TaxID=134959 RepID=A0A238YEW3_9ACTN|nr:hypothetical protein [Actinomadura mexicana]SNR69775.1 hypothetical protein SAMN06265355_105500 [Actinomadura mexicana]